MRSHIAILIFGITFTGCSSSYIVSSQPHEADGLSFSEFNAEVNDQSGTIIFTDSSTLDCRNILSQPDSTSWVNPITGERDARSSQNIRKIILKSRGRGVLEGIGIGILSGGAAGLLSAVTVLHVTKNGGGEPDPYIFIGMPALGGVTGLLTGCIIGAVSGHTYKYEFEDHVVNSQLWDSKRRPAELDDAQKKTLYEDSKISSAMAVPLSLILPSAGHAYAHNWGRGLLFASARVGGVVLALTSGYSGYIVLPLNHTSKFVTARYYIGYTSALVFSIWEAIDASDEVDRYNERLSKKIMGEKSLGINIIPSKNGPQLQLSYSF